MRVFRTLSLLIVLALVCCKAKKTNNNFDKTITAKFEIDEQNIDISDNFKIYFLQAGMNREARVKGNSLMIPQLADDTIVTVSFVYAPYQLEFKDVEKSRLFENQNMEWDFKIFNKNLARISSSIDSVGLKKVYVWGFNPQEVGDGIEIVNTIYK
jgi:hypothetical protein